MNTFAGMKVIVHRPVLSKWKRSWTERLFSLPFRPLQKTSENWIPANVSTNKGFLIGDTLHCGEQFHNEFLKETKAAA